MFSELLTYPFFKLALIGVAIISVAAAIIGSYIITRRMVAICGGVTHAGFGGLGLGYYLGISPVLMAGVFAVGSSLCVDWLSARLRVRQDSAIAVIWALGMAIGVLFVFLSPGYVPELNSFLFGNILTINTTDITSFAIYTAVLIAFVSWQWRRIIVCAFDPDFARVAGLPVRFVTTAMTVLVAVCIVLTIRLVGVMLLMSMLSLPMMVAEIFCHRMGPLMATSAIVSLLTCLGGLFISSMMDIPCSAVIVILMAAIFILAKTAKTFIALINNTRTSS